MRLDFKRVPENVLIKGMAEICQKREIQVSESALRIIAANADGSVRDGLSILDQCISGGDTLVDAKDVLEFLGASGEETFVELTELVRKSRTSEALILLAEVLADGKDVRLGKSLQKFTHDQVHKKSSGDNKYVYRKYRQNKKAEPVAGTFRYKQRNSRNIKDHERGEVVYSAANTA